MKLINKYPLAFIVMIVLGYFIWQAFEEKEERDLKKELLRLQIEEHNLKIELLKRLK